MGSILPTIVECCSVGGLLCALRAQGGGMNMFWDITLYWLCSANNFGVLFSWGLCVCPSGTRLRHVHVLRHIFVLDMFCQQFWGVVRLRGVHLYWIYSTNNCGVLFSWGVSVCPSGTMLGNVHVLRHIFVLDMFCQQFWGVVRLGGVHLYWIYSANDCGVLFSCGLWPNNCLFRWPDKCREDKCQTSKLHV